MHSVVPDEDKKEIIRSFDTGYKVVFGSNDTARSEGIPVRADPEFRFVHPNRGRTEGRM